MSGTFAPPLAAATRDTIKVGMHLNVHAHLNNLNVE